MAALSAALRVAALAPPVPSFAIAAWAAAEMVRDLWDVAPARTVAMLVVLRTDAWADAKRESSKMEVKVFMIRVEGLRIG